jgi:uncharacterized protein DUF2442
MNFLKNSNMKFFEYKASKIWLTDVDIFVELEDRRKASLPIKNFPLLFKASPKEREKFEIIDGYALHWPDLGEDLSIAGFFEQKSNNDSKDFTILPASANK